MSHENDEPNFNVTLSQQRQNRIDELSQHSLSQSQKNKSLSSLSQQQQQLDPNDIPSSQHSEKRDDKSQTKEPQQSQTTQILSSHKHSAFRSQRKDVNQDDEEEHEEENDIMNEQPPQIKAHRRARSRRHGAKGDQRPSLFKRLRRNASHTSEDDAEGAASSASPMSIASASDSDICSDKDHNQSNDQGNEDLQYIHSFQPQKASEKKDKPRVSKAPQTRERSSSSTQNAKDFENILQSVNSRKRPHIATKTSAKQNTPQNAIGVIESDDEELKHNNRLQDSFVEEEAKAPRLSTTTNDSSNGTRQNIIGSETRSGQPSISSSSNKRPRVDVTYFIREDFRILEEERLLLEAEMKAAADSTEDKKEARSAIPRRETEYSYCGWPVKTRMEAKTKFIKAMGMFDTSTSPEKIVKYLITLEQINASGNTAQVVWDLFTGDNGAKIEYNIRCNIAFVNQLEEVKHQLRGTPFERLSQDEFEARMNRHKVLHEENVNYYHQMIATREARAVGKPMKQLYTPPPSDNASQANIDLDGIKVEDSHKLLKFMFACAGRQELRRTETAVYAPRFTPEGLNTRCYMWYMDMEPWLRQQVSPEESYPAEYIWLTQRGGISNILAHIGKQPNPNFPMLVRCRTLFSFRNGIYCADTNQFYLYVTPETPITSKSIHSVYELDGAYSTAQYFDVVIPIEWFDEGFDYRTIDCKHHESILKSQKYEDDEIDWAQALFGRLQHDVGRKEDWQTALHLEGPAKTGKSVLLKLISAWYLATDIGLIGDDVEKTFSDQHLVGKFIVMCMDISREFGLTPSRFLSWCSGDWIIVNRKFQEAIAVKWIAPSIWASNHKPPIAASGGAGPRRFTILQLLHAIEKSNGNLFNDASKEVGYHLIKCAMSYHDKVAKWGKTGLWDDKNILPTRFWVARNDYTIASSWPDAFLKDKDRFIFHKDFFMDLSLFKDEYYAFKDLRKKITGVNNSKKAADTECTQIEFANALLDLPVKCEWDEEGQKIKGLQPKPNEKKTAGVLSQPSQQQRQGSMPPSTSADAAQAFSHPRPATNPSMLHQNTTLTRNTSSSSNTTTTLPPHPRSVTRTDLLAQSHASPSSSSSSSFLSPSSSSSFPSSSISSSASIIMPSTTASSVTTLSTTLSSPTLSAH